MTVLKNYLPTNQNMTNTLCPHCGQSIDEAIKQYHSELTKNAVATRNKNMSAERRSEIAGKAGKARWDKEKSYSENFPVSKEILTNDTEPIGLLGEAEVKELLEAVAITYRCNACPIVSTSKVMSDYHALSHKID